MAVDGRTEQRMSALANAQRVRLAKARLKESWADEPQAVVLREIAGRLEDDNDRSLDAFKLVELLTSVQGIGKTKAKLLAQGAEWLELTRKVGTLTARQCGVLARVLRSRADEVESRVQAA